MTGIYKITSPTDKVYIGQSYLIEKRFYQYKKLYCKDQYRIYNSLKKHGPDNHDFSIVCEMNDNVHPVVITQMEQYFMDAYSAMGYELMNLKGAGPKGKASEETKKRMSEVGKLIKRKPYVRVYTDEQRKAMSERAKLQHKLNPRVKKERILKYKKNGVYVFPDDIKAKYREERIGPKNYFYGKKHSDETKRLMAEKSKTNKLGTKNGRARAIYQCDLNGNIIKEYETIVSAVAETGIKRTTISSALNGHAKSAKGFIWKYKL
jgi:group I intron endonuclease